MEKYLLPRNSSGAKSFAGYNLQILYSIKHYLNNIFNQEFDHIKCECFDDFIITFENNNIEIYQSKTRKSGARRLSISEVIKKKKKTSLSILDELVENHNRFESVGFIVNKLVLLTDSDSYKDLVSINKFNEDNFVDENEKEKVLTEIDNLFEKLMESCKFGVTMEILQKLRFYDRHGTKEQVIAQIKQTIFEIIKEKTNKEIIDLMLPNNIFEKLYVIFSDATSEEDLQKSVIEKKKIYEILADYITEEKHEIAKIKKLGDLVYKMGRSHLSQEEVWKAEEYIIKKFSVFTTFSSYSEYRKDLEELKEIIILELNQIQKKYLGEISPLDLDVLYKRKIEEVIERLDTSIRLPRHQAINFAFGIFYENVKDCIFNWIVES